MPIANTSPGNETHGDRAASAALAFAVFGYSLTQTLVVPALSTIQTDLHASPAIGAWLLSAFLLAGVVLTPILGALGDERGARRVLLVVLGIFAVGGVVAALAPGIYVLIVARVAQGVSLAILPLSFALIRRVVSAPRQARSVGLVAGIGGAGAGAGLVISGPLTDLLGWRAMFGLSAIAAVVAIIWVLVAVARDLPVAPRRDGTRFDLPGAVILAAGLTTLLVGLTQGTRWGWSSPGVWVLLVAGMLVLALLGVVEQHRSRPLLDIGELRNPGLLATHVTALLIGAVTYPFYLLLPLWAKAPIVGTSAGPVGFGGTTTFAGLILLPGALSILVGSTLNPWLTKATGSRTPVVIGYALIFAVTIALVVFHYHVWQHVISFVVVGVATGFVFAAQPHLIALHVPVTRTGAANGFNSIARSVGATLATQITAAIIVATAGPNAPITDATFRTGCAFVAGLALLGLVVASFTTRRSQHVSDFGTALAMTGSGALPRGKADRIPLTQSLVAVKSSPTFDGP